ncbi:ATP-binding cassette sub-family A member 3 [Trichonephila clavipes]|nr:ATP-binding cassette sub-family A member 3 [Trichonephila clavipes]
MNSDIAYIPSSVWYKLGIFLLPSGALNTLTFFITFYEISGKVRSVKYLELLYVVLSGPIPTVTNGKFGAELAVNNMSLDIYQNQITVFLGRNGAGKTAIMNLLAGERHLDEWMKMWLSQVDATRYLNASIWQCGTTTVGSVELEDSVSGRQVPSVTAESPSEYMREYRARKKKLLKNTLLMLSLRDGNTTENLLMTSQINTDLVNHPVPLTTEPSTSLVHVETDACLSMPTSGTAFINGFDILTSTSKARRGLGVCPQHNVLFNCLTVEDHLKLYAAMKGVQWRNFDTKVTEVLSILKMSEKRNELIKNLSAGMKRKLSLGIAIVGGPEFGLAIHQKRSSKQGIDLSNGPKSEIAVVPDFHKRILFSDEAHFWLNGYINKQNCRIWNEVNPQVYVETPLHQEKLTVWCALWAGGIIGPYFFKKR